VPSHAVGKVLAAKFDEAFSFVTHDRPFTGIGLRQNAYEETLSLGHRIVFRTE